MYTVREHGLGAPWVIRPQELSTRAAKPGPLVGPLCYFQARTPDPAHDATSAAMSSAAATVIEQARQGRIEPTNFECERTALTETPDCAHEPLGRSFQYARYPL